MCILSLSLSSLSLSLTLTLFYAYSGIYPYPSWMDVDGWKQVKSRSHTQWLSTEIQRADMRGHGREMRAILSHARTDGVIDMGDASEVCNCILGVGCD